MREPGTVTPSLTFPDSEPIASVTLEPDAEPPVMSGPVYAPPAPRRPDAGSRWWAWRWAWRSSASPSPGSSCWAARRQHPRRCPRRQSLRPRRPRRWSPPSSRRQRHRCPPWRRPPPRRPRGADRPREEPRAATPAAAPKQPATPARSPSPRSAEPGRRHAGPSAHHAPRGGGRKKVAMQAPAAKRKRDDGDDDARARRSAPSTTNVATRCCSPGDSKGAIAAYREAIRSSPTDPSAFAALAWRTSSRREPVFAAPRAAPLSEARPERPRPRIVTRRLERLSHPSKRK